MMLEGSEVADKSSAEKKKQLGAETPIKKINRLQVSGVSEVSISKSMKSVSMGHSRVVLKSGNATLEERINEESSDIDKLRRENAELRIMELSE
jgi:predicted peroxiredoxin